ncbi:MAG: helix-turn-helix domain-containing protein [Bacillota bacterium]
MKKLLWIKGSKLKGLISASGYSIKKLSGELGISERTLYRWTSRDSFHITYSEARSLTALLNCTLSDLTTDKFSDIAITPKDLYVHELISKNIIGSLTFKNGCSVANTVLRALFSHEYDIKLRLHILLNLIIISIQAMKLKEVEELIAYTAILASQSEDVSIIEKTNLYKGLFYIFKGNTDDGFTLIDRVLHSPLLKRSDSLEVAVLKSRAVLVKIWALYLAGRTAEAYKLLQLDSPLIYSAESSLMVIRHNLQAFLVMGSVYTDSNLPKEAYINFKAGYKLADENKFSYAKDIFNIHLVDTAIILDPDTVSTRGDSICDFLSTVEDWHFSYPAIARVLRFYDRNQQALQLLQHGMEKLLDCPILYRSLQKELAKTHTDSSDILYRHKAGIS